MAAAERRAGTLEERQRLARDIHDTLAQGFTSIVMHLEAADQALPDDLDTLQKHLNISSTTGGTVDGIPFADENVLAFNPVTGSWTMLIDGSDIGLGPTDLTSFEWLTDGTMLMSFDTPITLPGIPSVVDDSDIVGFFPERLGATTSGRFELFLKGSTIGFSTDAERIDAFSVGSSGVLGDIGEGGELDPPEEDVKLVLPLIVR